MSSFSVTMGNFLAMAHRFGKGRNLSAKHKMNLPLYVRGLRLEPLEERTLLSVVGIVSGEELLTGPALVAAAPEVTIRDPQIVWDDESADSMRDGALLGSSAQMTERVASLGNSPSSDSAGVSRAIQDGVLKYDPFIVNNLESGIAHDSATSPVIASSSKSPATLSQTTVSPIDSAESSVVITSETIGNTVGEQMAVSSTLVATGENETISASAGSGYTIIERTPETKHLFKGDDKSDGIIILSIDAANLTPVDGADRQDLIPQSGIYWDWTGSIDIPDGPGGSWVGVDYGPPTIPPPGSIITEVKIEHAATHTYIGDLEVNIYNDAGTTWMVRDNKGGSANSFNETKWEYSLFDGDQAVQKWYYRIRDTASFDTGTLTKANLFLYYEESSVDLDMRDAGEVWLADAPQGNRVDNPVVGQQLYPHYSYTCHGTGTTPEFRREISLDGYGVWASNNYATATGGYVYTVWANSPWTVTSGISTWRADVDVYDTVDELDEGNNYSWHTYDVEVPLTDLTAPYVWWGLTTVAEGEPTWVEWEVKNEGDYHAASSHAKAWLSVDNDFDTSDDYYLGEKTVFALDPGDSDYPRWDFDMPDLGTGNYSVWMLCEVDSRDEVEESNEVNLRKSNDYFTATDALGEIRGSKWNDLDGDGVWDGGEPGLSGWRIYVDENLNGGWDSGEPYDWTDDNGDYAITGLAAGTYVVGEEPQAGWEQTYPGTDVSGGVFVASVELAGTPAGFHTISAANLPEASGTFGATLPDALLLPDEAQAELAELVELAELASLEQNSPPPAGQAPFGATLSDTTEYMMGDVWVTVVLLESDGSIDAQTENWTDTEINQVKSEIQEGLQWWEDTLLQAPVVDPLHDLNFHIDFTYADSPVETGYEPINRPQSNEGLWIDSFLNQVGYNSGSSYYTDMRRWDHDQRIDHNAHWAYTIFVVDSSADADGKFTGGHFAYAYLGGPFTVMTYDNDGWGIGNMGQVLAHETGHIFYALDEYPGSGSYTDRAGYYNTQNLNASDDHPNPGSRVASLMAEVALQNAAYANHTSSPSSLEMIGWKDSDGDGIFDALDVPLALTGTGSYNDTTYCYEFSGSSAVQVLTNLNPIGQGNDITTNTVDQIQYRIDSGAWQNGDSYGSYTPNVSLSVPIIGGGHQIEIRTVFAETGLTSAVFSDLFNAADLPATHTVNLSLGEIETGINFGNFQLVTISGQKFNDLDGDGEKDGGEPGLPNWTIRLDLDNNGSVDQTRVTDENGNYLFEDIGPGTHKLSEALQAGWVQTYPTPAPPGTYTLTMQSGQDELGKDFGNLQSMDFGDATATHYPTLLVNDGARHIIGGPHLGAVVDAEMDGQPTANADGDDNNGVPDDEDGVVFTTLIQNGTTAGVNVTASGTCVLNAWMDFNADGDWVDPGEQIFSNTALVGGLNSLTFTVPGGTATKAGASYARFRVNIAGGLSYTGQADDGEVEDYKVQLYSRVADRNIFYNNSAWDGNIVAPNAQDDDAIATDKSALLPGGTGSFANYTSYSGGITGIMVDIQGLADPGGIDASDFVFTYGNDDTPGDWLDADSPSSITVRAGEGMDGSDRITITWNRLDNPPEPLVNMSIPNRNWLQVTVLANADTGLTENDEFYFGNNPGENTGDFLVNYDDVFDVIWPSLFTTAAVDSPADINRDGLVNYNDLFNTNCVWDNLFGSPSLEPITPPASSAPALTSLDALWGKRFWAADLMWWNEERYGSSRESDEDETLEETAVDCVFAAY